jgi:hypothetical protein
MNKIYRLTVHLADVQKKDMQTGNRTKGANGKFHMETKRKIFNTLSFYEKDHDSVMRRLADLRSKYTIAKGTNPEKKDKYGKELINISFVK